MARDATRIYRETINSRVIKLTPLRVKLRGARSYKVKKIIASHFEMLRLFFFFNTEYFFSDEEANWLDDVVVTLEW